MPQALEQLGEGCVVKPANPVVRPIEASADVT